MPKGETCLPEGETCFGTKGQKSRQNKQLGGLFFIMSHDKQWDSHVT